MTAHADETGTAASRAFPGWALAEWADHILEQAGVGVTIVDRNGSVLFCNKWAAEHLDRKPEYLGRDVRERHHRAVTNPRWNAMLQLFLDGRDEPVRYVARPYGKTTMAKTLFVRAEIVEHLGDHETAKASLEEVGTLVSGCPDAGTVSALLASAERSASVAVTSRNVGCAVGEQLTAKELEVLRLLATRLSRREIGARLYVSLNTVKTHQRAVYRKLRVEHRSAAVSRARELGLL